MNKLLKRFITYYLNTRPTVPLIEIEIRILPYFISHCIHMERGEILFMDVYTESERYMPKENTPIAYIPIDAIIDIREISPNYLRILLRSGEYQLLDKYNGTRTHHTIKSLKELFFP